MSAFYSDGRNQPYLVEWLHDEPEGCICMPKDVCRRVEICEGLRSQDLRAAQLIICKPGVLKHTMTVYETIPSICAACICAASTVRAGSDMHSQMTHLTE